MSTTHSVVVGSVFRYIATEWYAAINSGEDRTRFIRRLSSHARLAMADELMLAIGTWTEATEEP